MEGTWGVPRQRVKTLVLVDWVYTLPCHHQHCTADSPHLPRLTPVSCALSEPLPSHLSPTSPLPHQDHPNISPCCFLKLPWVTGPHAQIMLACCGGAGQRGQEWVKRIETQSALFSHRVIFLAKTAITNERLVLKSEFRELSRCCPGNWLPPYSPARLKEKSRVNSEGLTARRFRPQYIALDLSWWITKFTLLLKHSVSVWKVSYYCKISKPCYSDGFVMQKSKNFKRIIIVIIHGTSWDVQYCPLTRNEILARPSKQASVHDRHCGVSQWTLPPTCKAKKLGLRGDARKKSAALVKVITLVSLHLICSLTDFQIVEWVNKVPRGTPAGDGLPQGCTHKGAGVPQPNVSRRQKPALDLNQRTGKLY